MNTLSISQSIKYITTLLLLTTIVACGGGGSDASSKNSNTTTNTTSTTSTTSTSVAKNDTEKQQVETTQQSTQQEVEAEIQAKNFSDLSVDQTFEFTNSNKLTLDIEIASLSSTAAYVSVCQVANKANKYADCLFRGKMTNGIINAAIELPNHIDNLSMAIWHLDGSNQRQQYNWQRANGMNWQVR